MNYIRKKLKRKLLNYLKLGAIVNHRLWLAFAAAKVKATTKTAETTATTARAAEEEQNERPEQFVVGQKVDFEILVADSFAHFQAHAAVFVVDLL